MRNSEANTSGVDPWTDLLRQARAALTSLRADELEELAGRAECMLEATVGNGTVRQRMSMPRKETLAGLARERGLLGGLLAETDRSLTILRRTQQMGRSDMRSGEVDSRWVR